MRLVARAVPSLTEDYIRYHLPQERGWSYAHTVQLEDGHDMRWPRLEDNPEGRWWNRLVKQFSRAATAAIDSFRKVK